MNTSFNDFINYCLDFYGVGGLYPENKRTKEQIAYATTLYLDACAYYEENNMPGMSWGNGDSLDRERVRDLMNNYYGVAS
jgi:hypothetical protein